MEKEKILNESKKAQTTNDQGVVSTDLLSVVDILSIKKYRSDWNGSVNQDYNKIRVVLDFDIKNNSQLYRMFRDLKNR